MYIVYSPNRIPMVCVSWEAAVIRAKEMAMSRRYAGVIADDVNGLTVHDFRK